MLNGMSYTFFGESLLTPSRIGAETFLTSLIGRLEFDIAINTSSLLCLKLEANLRKRAADALVPTSKMKVCGTSYFFF